MHTTGEMKTTPIHTAAADPSLWQHTRLFQGLDAATMDAIAARLSIRSFAPGDVFIEQGHWCGELYILRSGVAQVTVSQPDLAADPLGGVLRETPLRRLVVGDCFGEMSLITGELPSATVYALTDGEAWTLRQDDFQQLVRDYPALNGNIAIILSERLSHTSRQQAQRPTQHITLLLADPAPLWNDLARELAMLTGTEQQRHAGRGRSDRLTGR
jgi:CRP-like cAMP-binding protein